MSDASPPLRGAAALRESKAFEHDVDARWVMAYAAALGETAPHYFDTEAGRPLLAHPIFPVCLEWPAVLDVGRRSAETLANPTGGASVHATHDVHLHRPIAAGERLTTRARNIGIEQRKPGVYTTTVLETIDSTRNPVVTTYQGGLALGAELEGDAVPCEVPPWPQRPKPAEPRAEIPINVAAGTAHVYTECARIWNPIHTDIAVAHRAGLPDIILHGTANLALAVSAVLRHEADNDPAAAARVCGRFGAMVLMPSELTVRIEARERQDGREVVFFELLNPDGRAAVRDGCVVLR